MKVRGLSHARWGKMSYQEDEMQISNDAKATLEDFSVELQEQLTALKAELGSGNLEALIQNLQHLKAKASEAIAFLEALDDERDAAGND